MSADSTRKGQRGEVLARRVVTSGATVATGVSVVRAPNGRTEILAFVDGLDGVPRFAVAYPSRRVSALLEAIVSACREAGIEVAPPAAPSAPWGTWERPRTSGRWLHGAWVEDGR